MKEIIDVETVGEITEMSSMQNDMQFLREGEKIDDLQRSGLRIIQDPARFCFGMDAVLLTGFVQDGIGGSGHGNRDHPAAIVGQDGLQVFDRA